MKKTRKQAKTAKKPLLCVRRKRGIMGNIVEELDSINRTFARHIEIMQKMLDIMPKPESRFNRVFDTVVLIVTVLGILNAVDIIRRWIIGG
ncbi:MAG: hypothetical protein FWF55_04625 [Treponema sp.]|nr:hypothetical protein [Treponema sp.]